MKYMIFSLLFLSAIFSAAATPDLKGFLAKKTFVLDRPMLVFHYRSWNYDPKTQAEAWSLVRDAAQNFFRADLDNDPNMMGPGFYVSVDPAATRTYGLSVPQLYAVTLSKGARILDARDINPEKEQAELKNAGAEFNCFKGSAGRVGLDNLRNSPSKTCQAVLLQTLKDLHVDAIIYGYSASGSLEGCRNTRDEALNIISVEHINANGVLFYSPKTKLETNPKQGAEILELFREGAKDSSVHFMPNQEVPPDSLLTEPAISKEEFSQFKASLIWKCGPARPAEALPGDRMQGYFKAAYNIGDFQKLLSEMTLAYTSKYGYSNYPTVHRLRGLLHLQYKVSRMAPDDSKFDQWLKGYLGVYDSSGALTSPSPDNSLVNQLSELFEEKPQLLPPAQKDRVLTEIAAQFTNLDKDPYLAYPGIYYSFMRSLGGGPRLTAAAVSTLLPIPIVIGPVPTDPNHDYTEYMLKNRAYVMHFMRGCLAIYKDPNLTEAQVQAGACGIVKSIRIQQPLN